MRGLKPLGSAAAVPLALGLCACAVGPNYHPPAPPADHGYTAEALPAQTASVGVAGGQAQRFAVGADLPGAWWRLFGSSRLDALIEQAMTNYPDIAAQQAALRQAREDVRAEGGVFLPQLQGSFNAAREKISGAAIAPGLPEFITSIYQANVNVSYTFDLFGGERRTLEGLQAQALSQSFKLEASYLTLTSNVVSTAIQLAAAHDQITATQAIIALETRQLSIATRRFELGSQTRADVLQQQSNLATVRATLPALQQQQAQAQHALAVLTGRLPHDAAPLQLSLADLTLPQQLPLSLPSSLVGQRPDIREQAALVHQASAAIGVATANLLPQLTLDGSLGGESLRLASLLEPGSNVWNLAGGLTQPLFQGGTLRAKRRAAIDAFDQAAAQYRLTVLQAFQNVADTLTALGNDAEALKAQYDALNAAQASLDLIQRQYAIGAVDSVTLLSAQQAYQQARVAYVRALASRYTDTVTLFQALGGGWWNRTDAGTLPAPRPAAAPGPAAAPSPSSTQ
ncbi:MAG TPA: efflux transporter outer membrane subunit [Steroidobacteraceae bacterium]|jgi:NodT family efflux transporter outer membrane factor (OMF) lipoprotein|nr:efflux transporter outer membrane subunit [Steroidobacteraceae bacterium]